MIAKCFRLKRESELERGILVLYAKTSSRTRHRLGEPWFPVSGRVSKYHLTNTQRQVGSLMRDQVVFPFLPESNRYNMLMGEQEYRKRANGGVISFE